MKRALELLAKIHAQAWKAPPVLPSLDELALLIRDARESVTLSTVTASDI